VKVVKIAREYRVPITPYSGATSLEGQFSGVSVMLCSIHKYTFIGYHIEASGGKYLSGYVFDGSNIKYQWYLDEINPTVKLIIAYSQLMMET
jgi:hypothetical protein